MSNTLQLPKQMPGFALKQDDGIFLLFWNEIDANIYMAENNDCWKAGIIILTPPDIAMLVSCGRLPNFIFSKEPVFAKLVIIK